jgi:hypothetical protein
MVEGSLPPTLAARRLLAAHAGSALFADHEIGSYGEDAESG